MLSEMTTQELRQLPSKELFAELRRAQGVAEKFSLSVKTGQEKNSAKLRLAKRYVARVSTIVTEFTILSK